MILPLYRAATGLGRPIIRLYLARRRRRGKEDPVRHPERLGHPGAPRPAGRLVWLHAASVGESLSALPLIERLLAVGPDVHVVVTTVTITSAALMAKRLPARAIHQFVPVDVAAYMRRFLDHWRPDLAIWLESELWPNMLVETAARGVPSVLVNGRVSARSYRGWKRFPGVAARLLGCFTACLGQTETDAERLRNLGAVAADCVGNLKFAAPPLPFDAAEHARLAAALGTRPLWLAASTHAGEEAICAAVHARLAAEFPGLLTVIVPRHPNRGAEIQALLTADGFRVKRRSEGKCFDNDTNIYLADTIGELGLFFRLGRVVFIGKSLVSDGGQNPLEAARLGCAVLFGPRMSNFSEIADRLTDGGGARMVADPGALAGGIAALLRDPGAAEAQGKAALAVAEAEAGVLDRVMDRLTPFLAGKGGRHAGA